MLGDQAPAIYNTRFQNVNHYFGGEAGSSLFPVGGIHAITVFTARLVFSGFPGGSDGKESTCNAEDQIGQVPWKRKRQPTPVFLPGESCGERSLVRQKFMESYRLLLAAEALIPLTLVGCLHSSWKEMTNFNW